MTTSELKRCPKCGQEKPLDAFGRNLSTASGRDSRCKSCEVTRSKDRRAHYRERNLRLRELDLSESA